MTIVPTRPRQATGAVTMADTDGFPIDGDAGMRFLQLSALRSLMVGSIAGAMTYRGTLAGASVPNTSTAAGDYYLITSAGASQGKSWQPGEIALYRGSTGVWDRVAVWPNRDVVNVRDYGAVGDGVTDDSAAIQAAINDVISSGTKSTVFFPPGIYRTTVQLNVTDRCRLVGSGCEGATSFSPLQWAGSMIRYEGGAGTYALAFANGTTNVFRVEVADLRFGTIGQSPAPHGLLLSRCSEFVFRNVQITGGFNYGIHAKLSTLIAWYDLLCEANQVGLRVENISSLGILNWSFFKCNFYQNSVAHVQSAGSMENVFFHGWFEDAPFTWNVPPPTEDISLVSVVFDHCGFNHSANAGGRAFKIDGGSSTHSVIVRGFSVRDSRIYMANAYAAEFLLTNNTGGNTSCRSVEFYNCFGHAISTAMVLTDSQNTSFFFCSATKCWDAIGGGNEMPFVSGPAQMFVDTVELAYRDFSQGPGKGAPFRLPGAAPYQALDGIFGYDYSQHRPYWYVGTNITDVRYAAAVDASNNLLASSFKALNLPVYASNALAISGGLVAGQAYRNGDNICVVH